MSARDLTDEDAESIRVIAQRLMKRCNNTYDGLAKAIGKDPGTVSRFMRKESQGSFGLARLIADAANVPLEEALSQN